MSKYQYYEFQAIDCCMTDKETGELSYLALDTLVNFSPIDHELSPLLEQITSDSNDIRAWLVDFTNHEQENILADILKSSIKGNQSSSLQGVHPFNKSWQVNKIDPPKRQRTAAEKKLNPSRYLGTVKKQKGQLQTLSITKTLHLTSKRDPFHGTRDKTF